MNAIEPGPAIKLPSRLPDVSVPFGLVVNQGAMTDSGLKELAGLQQLETLDPRSTEVTDVGMKELAGLQRLQTLRLVDTPVTDVGLKELAGLKQLKTLVLFNTKVTDKGFKELAGFQQMQTLHVSGAPVTNAGLKELAGLKQLHTLYLNDSTRPFYATRVAYQLMYRGTNAIGVSPSRARPLGDHTLRHRRDEPGVPRQGRRMAAPRRHGEPISVRRLPGCHAILQRWFLFTEERNR